RIRRVRAEPGSQRQSGSSKAARADATARVTSLDPPCATSANGSAVDGSSTARDSALSTASPPMSIRRRVASQSTTEGSRAAVELAIPAILQQGWVADQAEISDASSPLSALNTRSQK